jgi:hypothetical protein
LPASDLPLRHKPGEMLKRPVIRAFRIGREITGRQFSGCQMKFQAIAAAAFSRTWFVAAITLFLVSLLLAFHIDSRFQIPDSRFQIPDSRFLRFESEILNH